MKYLSISEYHATEDTIADVVRVIRLGRLSEGENVEKFESAWANYIGTEYCVAFSSGSAALLGALLAIRNSDLFRGDALLTNPNSYIAVAHAISLAGYQPVFVDVEPMTFGKMNTDDMERAIRASSSRIGGIIPVHLFGFPEGMDKIMALASEFGIPVVEDVSQAHGTTFADRKLGALGDIGVFSFRMGHILQAGEMGAATTDDFHLYRQMKLVKDQGRPISDRNIESWFTSTSFGFNFKTTEINAILALSEVKKVDQIVKQRIENAKTLSESLQKWTEILRIPEYTDGTCPFAFPILIDSESISRNEVCMRLDKIGIETRPMFPCIPLEQPSYSILKQSCQQEMGNSLNLSRQAFYVGCHQYLTPNDISQLAFELGRIVDELST